MAKKEGAGTKRYYLMCERKWVYLTMTAVAGFFGAYTYLLRGGVFCNAQTGNIVLMGLALGGGRWSAALYYLIPVAAYLAGTMVSELLPNPVKHHLAVRWDTLLVLVEMAAVLALGFVPDAAPVQIAQITINFIASMQYNTFRQAEGVPVATTFVTNHVRQVGVGLAKELQHLHSADKGHRRKLQTHAELLFVFLLGVTVGAFCCGHLGGRAIWVALAPLAIVFAALLRADRTSERELVEQKPGGH